MKKWKTVLLTAAVLFLLTGCGKTVAEVTTIAIQKDGTVEHTIIEAYEGDSVESLQNMLLKKTAEYNNTVSGEGVSLDLVEETDGVVRVVMSYPSAADFDGFMNMDVTAIDPEMRAPFFYGTVEEAFAEGYDLKAVLHGVENDNLLQGKDDILPMGKNKIVIYDNRMNLGAAVQISVQEPLLYISDNVTVVGKKVAEVSDTDELAYILLEG